MANKYRNHTNNKQLHPRASKLIEAYAASLKLRFDHRHKS
jgi:hypothetical protein